ncbi:MAG: UDP-3-O-(3-hydroxymyristoyl)glucosamine N-acyltransferase [Bacteroidales bacterium]|nr:UDP-3-O-(3-hydroxymyristoyl)glucosamine N-acyltransferase [Candidatus Cryptobacteroides aphodequi]
MKFTAKELADVLKGTVDGNPQAEATTFAKIEHGKPGTLCFYANPKYEKYVYSSKCSILLVNNDFVPKAEVGPTMIRVENAYEALAELLDYVSKIRRKYRRHRGRCRIACSARLGHKVWVGDYVTIGKKTTVGDRTRICNNVTIGENVKIGSDCIIYSGASIFPGTVIGDRTILHAGCVIGDDGFGNARQPDGSWKKIEHLGNVIIGSDVEIGSNTTIDRAPMESTVIGNGARIDNLCLIAHNVQVGENTAMAGMTGVAGSAIIGKNCIFGGQSGVVGHVKIADNTTLTACSGIIGNVRTEGQVLSGFPAIPHTTWLRAYAKFKESGKE